MPAGRVARLRAFTLIELLVVVAIIALLISILLPALTRAREQGRTVKCIANLSSIGKAMNMYFTDHKDWFPFEKRNISTFTPLHGFYYGGHPGRQYNASDWWGFIGANFRDTPRGRPFNPYMFDSLPDFNPPTTDPLFETVRNELTTIYGCPSDTGGFWNSQTDELESEVPIHYGCGSSYDFNYHFVWRWAAGFGAMPARQKYLERGNKFLAKQRQFHVSRFIMLFEDPFDSAQWNGINRFGWHKQWSRHSALFLDGHAANMTLDTGGNKNFGPGWKTSAGNWFTNPDDPDYEYRTILP